jgi:Co/Zn/Cd efflux system component
MKESDDQTLFLHTESTAQFYHQAYKDFEKENVVYVNEDDRGICYTRDISSPEPHDSGVFSFLGYKRARSNDAEFGSQVNVAALELDIGLAHETRGFRKWCRFLTNALCPCFWRNHYGLEDKPSNEELLTLAFVSFLTFTISQTVAGLVADSSALIVDASAMAIDSFTYGFNLIAERMKNRIEAHISYKEQPSHNLTEEEFERRLERSKRKLTLQLEIVPPIVSILTLVIVTSIILKESIDELQVDVKEEDEDPDHLQSNPNMNVMLVFSSLNLLVDLVNVLFFTQSDNVFGFQTRHDSGYNNTHQVDDNLPISPTGSVDKEKNSTVEQSTPVGIKGLIQDAYESIYTEKTRRNGGAYSLASQRRESEDEAEHYGDLELQGVGSTTVPKNTMDSLDEHDASKFSIDNDHAALNDSEEHIYLDESVSNQNIFTGDELQDEDVDKMIAEFEKRKVRSNLNMCSAYTHVLADTVSLSMYIFFSVL